MDKIREKLAEYAHEAWSGWMLHLFEKSELLDNGTAIIPKWAVERWTRQMTTRYDELPEEDKKSDRVEADRMLAIMGKPFHCFHSDLEKDPIDRGIFCKRCGLMIGRLEAPKPREVSTGMHFDQLTYDDAVPENSMDEEMDTTERFSQTDRKQNKEVTDETK